MVRHASLALCIVVLGCCSIVRAEAETLQDFLDDPQRMHDVKLIALLLSSQVDPAVGPKNTAELRRSFWPARAEAGLDARTAEAEMAKLDAQWAQVARVIRERHMTAMSFVGMDLVLLKQAQDWYFGGVTPRGPVLIRISIQYNPTTPVTVHGMRVWTNWDDVKAASSAIQLKAGNKVLTCTYEPKPPADPGTQPNPAAP